MSEQITAVGSPMATPRVNEPTASVVQDMPIVAGSTMSPVQASVHPVVSAVVNGVYASSSVAPQNAAAVAANILNAVANEAPLVLQLTRASPRSSAWVVLGLESLEAILAAIFPHPRG